MSYDISLEIDTGIEMTEVAALRSSISANYSKVLRALFNVESFYEMSHKEAGELIPILQEAIKELAYSDRIFFYDSFIPYHKGCSSTELETYLMDLLELCRNHPKCTVIIR